MKLKFVSSTLINGKESKKVDNSQPNNKGQTNRLYAKPDKIKLYGKTYKRKNRGEYD